jgi:hypothetical protein
MQISWVIYLFFVLFFTHVLFVCSIFMFAHVIVFFFPKEIGLVCFNASFFLSARSIWRSDGFRPT